MKPALLEALEGARPLAMLATGLALVAAFGDGSQAELSYYVLAAAILQGLGFVSDWLHERWRKRMSEATEGIREIAELVKSERHLPFRR